MIVDRYEKKNLISDKCTKDLVKYILNVEKQQYTVVADYLNKLAIIPEKLTYLLKILFKVQASEEQIKIQIQSPVISQMVYILIYKLNPTFFDSWQFPFNELTFLQDGIKSSHDAILLLNHTRSRQFTFHLCTIVIFLMVLKLKYSISEYSTVDWILQLKSQLEHEQCHTLVHLVTVFQEGYLDLNSYIGYASSIEFLLHSQIFDELISSFSSNHDIHVKYDPTLLKYFKDFLSGDKPYIESKITPSKDFVLFDRHITLKEKITELLHIAPNARIMLYGSPSSGKSSFAKIFLKDEVQIEVDETMEIGHLIGGYMINEFSEIVWQDGLLIRALKENRDILFTHMEKCGNDLLFILQQIIEKNSLFINLKQESLSFSECHSKVFFIYNTNEERDILQNGCDFLFTFFKENSFAYHLPLYTNSEKKEISLYQCQLMGKINIGMENIISICSEISCKYKTSTRYRRLTLSDMRKFCKRTENFLKSIFSDDEDTSKYISEGNRMKIMSWFIFLFLFTLDDKELLSQICNDFARCFNFSQCTFSNMILNLNDIYSNVDDMSNEFNYVKTFFDEKNVIAFSSLLTNDHFYSYNSNSKFYMKLINECVMNGDNILLVGETGVGKTRMIQNLACVMNTQLNIINLSQSSDESDLFGGFKPVNSQFYLMKYFEQILQIVKKNFNIDKNQKFIHCLYEAYQKKDNDFFIRYSLACLDKILIKITSGAEEDTAYASSLFEVNKIKLELIKFHNAIKKVSYNAFKYIDGILLHAIKNDEWILLDEINLANDELLLKLKPILQGNDLYLVENDELKIYKRGPKFRIFGSMNPEYHIGKKRLPSEIRMEFSEIFINEISDFNDLRSFVKKYLGELSASANFEAAITGITEFYMFIKSKQKLGEIQKANHSKCTFSLRNLTRMLLSIRQGCKFYDLSTAVSEAIAMNFLSQMDGSSKNLVMNKFKDSSGSKIKIGTQIKDSTCNQLLSTDYEDFNHYFIKREFINPTLIDKNIDSKFILTPMFEDHLNNLLRIISLSNYAVLLEGPTSCGKTSIIEYLGKRLGQKVLRINNNQNTEIEEYLGSYTTDSKGNFFFNEGFLVKAVKEGDWIILDEINLAPSEVLEALNRLLDDNRELYLSESNITIKAHPNFRIFAAMNPSEVYAGRKDLSEAFKNRFIHLFFDNIPSDELEIIIEKRCAIAHSRAEVMVKIFNELQMIRSSEKVFSRNEGFITIRDLLKWGGRNVNSYSDLAYEGFFVIAEKLRSEDERQIIQNVIETHIRDAYTKKFSMNFTEYFDLYSTHTFTLNCSFLCMSKPMKRALSLIHKSFENKEPVLLIGETGTGKTIAAEYLSQFYQKRLITVNCHENMDTNDFLGSLRSVYGREDKSKLFEWVDGPLTSAMKNGDMLLIDEISLVLDSVLERMNSVFEADRVLVLSEKQESDSVEVIYPKEGFMVIGTTSPGGDHGKKELSPALRSRFTEIYIDIEYSKNDCIGLAKDLNRAFEINEEKIFNRILNDYNSNDIFSIICFKIQRVEQMNDEQRNLCSEMIFCLYVWFNFHYICTQTQIQIAKSMTFRDVDLICDYFSENFNLSSFAQTYAHSISMALLDGLFLNESSKPEYLITFKTTLKKFIQFQEHYINSFFLNDNLHQQIFNVSDNDTCFGISPFLLTKSHSCQNVNFVFHTENISVNLLKVLRGLSVHKPILIEGSPGVGKTTIVQNIAKKIGKKIYRVNLSEHTDMIDLIGTEFPTDELSDRGVKFKWVDGVFLKALLNGDWIIIDEMNLASQSILEGLNSVLDHRKSIFVTELSKEFKCHPGFQIFATQNPVNQGGGRKYLPKSFLNRFVKIYLEDLTEADYVGILSCLFPHVDYDLIVRFTRLNCAFQDIVYMKHKIPLSEAGEFNLRTLSKLLQCVEMGRYKMENLVELLFISRIRNAQAKQEMREIYREMLDSQGKNQDQDQQAVNNQNQGKCFRIPYIESSKYTIKSSIIDTYLDKLQICIDNNFPVIITGPSGTGKKEIVRYLARRSNQSLFEFSLNSSMDSTELLGNFDKISLAYHFTLIKDEIRKCIEGHLPEIIISGNKNPEAVFAQVMHIIDYLNQMISNIGNIQHIKSQVRVFINMLTELEAQLNTKLNINFYTVNKVIQCIESETFNFEWHDSILIKCIMNGYWIILDNVNTCSAAVLDRLNSLLDDDKQIYLNECGEGEGRAVTPHKDFRIFLIMNDKLGEVSRALKNRCIEIYIDKCELEVKIKSSSLGVNEYSIAIPNEEEVIIQYQSKEISIKRKCLRDLIVLSQTVINTSYHTSYEIAMVYLIYVVDSEKEKDSACALIHWSLFKKILMLIDYFLKRDNCQDIITAAHLSLSLLTVKDSQGMPMQIGNLIHSIRKFFSFAGDDSYSYSYSYTRKHECSYSSISITPLALRYNLNFGYRTQGIVAFIQYLLSVKFANETILNELNKLANKKDKCQFYRNILSSDYDTHFTNGNTLSNDIEFTSLVYSCEMSNSFIFNLLANHISVNETDFHQFVVKIFQNCNQKKEIIKNFISKFGIHVVFTLLRLNIVQFNSQEIDSMTVLNENLVKRIKSNGQQSLVRMFKSFYLEMINFDFLCNHYIKLLPPGEEISIRKFFSLIRETANSEENNLDLFFSLLDFIKEIESNEREIKFIKSNPTTFCYSMNRIYNKYFVSHMKMDVDAEAKAKAKKVSSLGKSKSTERKIMFTKEDFDAIYKEFHFKKTGTIESKVQFMCLECDNKKVSSFESPMSVKNYQALFELQEGLLLLPIITNKTHLLHIDSFCENFLHITQYLSDFQLVYSFVKSNSVNSFSQLSNGGYLQKLNAKSPLQESYLFFIGKCMKSMTGVSLLVAIDLTRLLLIEEYCDIRKVLSKLMFLNKECLPLHECLVENCKKMSIVPVAYFYSKICSNDILECRQCLFEMMNGSWRIEVLTDIFTRFIRSYDIEEITMPTEMNLKTMISITKMVSSLTVPCKEKISKILGKDLFQLFYSMVLETKSRFIIAENIISQFEDECSTSNTLDIQSQLDAYNLFKKRLSKFEAMPYRGDNYDKFISDISSLVEQMNLVSQIEITETKHKLIAFINNHMLFFDDLILPFCLSSLLFLTCLEIDNTTNNRTEYNNNELFNLVPPLSVDSCKSKLNILTQTGNKALQFEYLSRSCSEFNKSTMLSVLCDIYCEIRGEHELKENEEERIKIKKYEDFGMKVMAHSVALGEISKRDRAEKNIEEENMEIEENFPTYIGDFISHGHADLSEMTKNISIKKYYSNIEPTDGKLKCGGNPKSSELYLAFSKTVGIEDSGMQGMNETKWYSQRYTAMRGYMEKYSNVVTNSHAVCIYLHHFFNFFKIHSRENSPVKFDLEQQQSLPSALSHFNFYKDPNPEEMKILYIPLNKLLDKARLFLLEYQDHPLLTLICIISFNLLILDIHSTPLSKLLTGLDLLLTKLHEWEVYASKKINSFEEEIKLIMMIIRRYRKLEVLSWKGIVNSKLSEYEKNDCMGHFENILNICFDDPLSKTNEILSTINLFILNSTISTFNFRLNCIRIMIEIIKFKFKCENENETAKKLVNALTNIHSFYFINYISTGKFEEYFNTQIAEVERKVKELMNIAKWDIKNYFNFKENMRRNYKQLNKIIKGQDNFCLLSLREFIEQTTRDFIAKDYVLNKLVTAGRTTVENESVNVNVNCFEMISCEIFARLEGLKSITSGSNKVFKNKALIDLIKCMKGLGFSTVYKYMQAEVFEQFQFISVNYQCEEKLKKCSCYIVKILEKINHFALQDTISEDLNNRYLNVMKGLSFSCFFKCLDAYRKYQDLEQFFAKLVKEFYMNNQQCISEGDVLIQIRDVIKHFLSQLTMEIHDIYGDDISGNYERFSISLRNLKMIFKNYANFIELNTTENGKIMITKDNYGVILKFIQRFKELFLNDLKKIIETEYPMIIYLFSPFFMQMESLIGNLNSLIFANLTDEQCKYDPTTSYFDFISQQIYATSLDSSLNETLMHFYEASISDIKVDDFLQYISSFFLINPNDQSTLAYLGKIAIPHIIDIIQSLLKLANLSISIFYNAAVNGFCQPNNQDKDKATNEQHGVQEGGFGMAEGEGVEDVAQEIEDEEQLLGLKEENMEKGEQQNKEKPFDKKSGFEMQSDFKEDYKKEIPIEEEEDSPKDDEECEREEDKVENENGNQMYDKDNDIGTEENNPKEEKNQTVDLTDKKVSAHDSKKQDNQYKPKEKQKTNEKEVDSVNEEMKSQQEDEDVNNNNSNNKNLEEKRIEKLDVDKQATEKDKNSDMEIENDEEEEEAISNPLEKNQDDQENQNQVQKESPIEELLDDEKKPNEISDEKSMEEEEIIGNAEEENSEDENENEKTIEKHNDELVDEEPGDENLDIALKSKPLATKDNDLGYNPLTKTTGSGGNTAQNISEQRKENKNEESQNNDIDLDQLKDLEKYQEIFDLNSMLESAWTTRPNQSKRPRPSKSNTSAKSNTNIDVNENMKDVIENFEFQNKKIPDLEQNEIDMKKHKEAEFNQGYIDEKDNISTDKLAKGTGAKESKVEISNNDVDGDEKIDNQMIEEDIQINNQCDYVENLKDENMIDYISASEDNQENEEKEKENPLKEITQEGIESYIKQKTERKDTLSNIIINTDENSSSDINTNESHTDIAKLQQDTISEFNSWIKSHDSKAGFDLWNRLEQISLNHINKLTELLKIALEPNKQTKLRGNYKSGKRLNLKKIIGFIASNYRQDKIWLRRTLPFDRNYYVTLAIDDSLSMKEHNLGFFALESLVIVSTALGKAGIGKLCICSIKDDLEVYNSFNDVLTRDKAVFIASKFKFDFSSRNSHDVAMQRFMKNSMQMLDNASITNIGAKINQIVFIISDGRFNKDNVRALCNEAKEKGLLYIFIILDQYGIHNPNSILNMSSVKQIQKANGEYDIDVKPYLNDFPFQYYVIVEDSSDLPEVIQTILVKWFSFAN